MLLFGLGFISGAAFFIVVARLTLGKTHKKPEKKNGGTEQ